MEAEGSLTRDILDVVLARLEVAGTGAVTAGLRWDRERGEATDWGFITERIGLEAAMRDWIQPWLSSLGFPEWRASGHARFSAEWIAGGLRRFYAGLEEARLADGTGHIELDGVNARIPWEEGVPTEAEIGVAAGRLGDLPLRGFTLPLKMDGNEATKSSATTSFHAGRLEQKRHSRADRLPMLELWDLARQATPDPARRSPVDTDPSRTTRSATDG